MDRSAHAEPLGPPCSEHCRCCRRPEVFLLSFLDRRWGVRSLLSTAAMPSIKKLPKMVVHLNDEANLRESRPKSAQKMSDLSPCASGISRNRFQACIKVQCCSCCVSICTWSANSLGRSAVSGCKLHFEIKTSILFTFGGVKHRQADTVFLRRAGFEPRLLSTRAQNKAEAESKLCG